MLPYGLYSPGHYRAGDGGFPLHRRQMLKGGFYTLMSVSVLLQAVSLPPQWEIFKGVMITVGCAGIMWLCRTVFVLRDKLMKAEPALKNVSLMSKQIRALQNWRIRLEAVAQSEKANYHGPERRHGARRLRDVVSEAQEMEIIEATSGEIPIFGHDINEEEEDS